jgi:hypothetical protein
MSQLNSGFTTISARFESYPPPLNVVFSSDGEKILKHNMKDRLKRGLVWDKTRKNIKDASLPLGTRKRAEVRVLVLFDDENT